MNYCALQQQYESKNPMTINVIQARILTDEYNKTSPALAMLDEQVSAKIEAAARKGESSITIPYSDSLASTYQALRRLLVNEYGFDVLPQYNGGSLSELLISW